MFDILAGFEIGEDYYILGNYPKYETTFEVVKVEKGKMYVSPPWWDREEYLSGLHPFFPEYDRHFDSVIVCDGFIDMIEVFDFDTIVIKKLNAWLLYKRVE